MLKEIDLEPRQVNDYRAVVGDDLIDEIQELAAPIRGARFVHVNATAFGGGVAEILTTLVPLMRSVGLDAHWQVIAGQDEFYQVTKSCHNGLQGADIPFTPEMRAIWQRYNVANAEQFEGAWDVAIIHDPQPAGLRHYSRNDAIRHWVWRCHIDTSNANPAYQSFFAPYVMAYETTIFTMRQYVLPGVPAEKVRIVPPTIDPLTVKNMVVSPDTARGILHRHGIDPDRPIISQVSRFDPWKDPLGVIDAYRLIKPQVPALQLVLAGSMAADDPEGWEYVRKTRERADGDPDIHILQNLGDVEIAALQAHSRVVLQKSIREGFGLTVSEALWKGRPVVGGNVGGITLQIVDGENGYLVSSVEECAERTLYLLRHPEEADRMGRNGREYVRNRFFITRLLRDDILLARDLLLPAAPTGAGVRAAVQGGGT
ncbi:MAG: glycosyltransferase [Anaerolineae bacterium]